MPNPERSFGFRTTSINFDKHGKQRLGGFCSLETVLHFVDKLLTALLEQDLAQPSGLGTGTLASPL